MLQPEQQQEYLDAPPAYEQASGTHIHATDDKNATLLHDEDSESDSDPTEDDSEVSELDDALAETDSRGLPTYEESEAMRETETMEDLVQAVVGQRGSHLNASTFDSAAIRSSLPAPVIIPQRRSGKRARGFVRAYAPALGDCGIEQETFLRFLENFQRSSQASPAFNTIQIAVSSIAGLAPSVIPKAVTTTAKIGARASAEIQSRNRPNDFLDRMNDEVFEPAGLYAMIVKYKHDTDSQRAVGRQWSLSSHANMITAEKVDFSTNKVIARYNGAGEEIENDETMSDRLKNLALVSDDGRATIELPEAAPLIYPDIDKKLARAGPDTFKDKTTDIESIRTDYLDRRAAIQYAQQHPSSLPQSERMFKSPPAAPTHLMHSGGLVTLLSGGKLTPTADKRARRRERHIERDVRRIRAGRGPRSRTRYDDKYHEEVAARSGDHHTAGAESSNHSLIYLKGSLGRSVGTVAQPFSISSRKEVYPARDTRDHAGEGSSSGAYQGRGGRRDRRDGRKRRVDNVRSGKGITRENVLYLMIVNMPSEKELAQARADVRGCDVASSDVVHAEAS